MAARLFIRQWQLQHSSAKLLSWCVFILGLQYLSLGVLRHVFGVRYAVSVLVIQLIPSEFTVFESRRFGVL